MANPLSAHFWPPQTKMKGIMMSTQAAVEVNGELYTLLHPYLGAGSDGIRIGVATNGLFGVIVCSQDHKQWWARGGYKSYNSAKTIANRLRREIGSTPMGCLAELLDKWQSAGRGRPDQGNTEWLSTRAPKWLKEEIEETAEAQGKSRARVVLDRLLAGSHGYRGEGPPPADTDVSEI